MMTQRHEDSDDDTYVTLGSAFEKLETVEDVEKAKRKKDKEQYVTDDRGRRRFHGAFTGGFSAGYFNTVGSEEGNKLVYSCRVTTLYPPSYSFQDGVLPTLCPQRERSQNFLVSVQKILWMLK